MAAKRSVQPDAEPEQVPSCFSMDNITKIAKLAAAKLWH